jgi:hypothetical protein
MDAYEMTKMAKNFKSLSDQQNCTTTFPNFENRFASIKSSNIYLEQSQTTWE